MKWLFLLLLAFGSVGLLLLLKRQPNLIRWVAFAAGIVTFLLIPFDLYVAPVSWSKYIGTVKGLEVSLLDALAVAIFLACPKARVSPALIVALSIFAIGWLLSTVSVGMWQPPIFYAWQVGRAALLFAALNRMVSSRPETAIWVLSGVFVGLLFEAAVAVLQYIQGGERVGGSFGHANTLGLASHFATMPALALLLAGRRTKIAILVLMAGLIIAATGGSRATIGFLGIGFAITLFFSITHHRTGRKTGLAAALALVALVSAPIMKSSIGQRDAAQIASSNSERRNLERAAWMMIAENPLGVGAVRYVPVANLGGYSERAGVAWNAANRSAPVHNAYLLVMAEMGIVGVLGFIMIIGAVILCGWRALRRKRIGEHADLIVGLTASLLIVAGHAFFEWTAMTFPIHYLFAINAGVMFGLINALQRQQNAGRLKARVARPRAIRGRRARA